MRLGPSRQNRFENRSRCLGFRLNRSVGSVAYPKRARASPGAEDRRCWHRLRRRSTLRRLLNLRRGSRKQSSLRRLEALRRRWQRDPSLGAALLFLQGALLCAYTGLADYHSHADAADKHNSVHAAYGGLSPEKNILRRYYDSELHIFTSSR